MKFRFKLFIVLPMLCIFIGCKSQTIEEQITSTAKGVLSTIEQNDVKGFEKWIGVELSQIGKNTELITFDFKNIYTHYKKLLGKQPKIIITNEYNPLGSRKVIIPFTDSKNETMQLELYFGPSKFVPLTKIANYKVKESKSSSDSTTQPPGIIQP